VRRNRLVAVAVTIVAAIVASFAVASPAHANYNGTPTSNYYAGYAGLCLAPQNNAPWQGTLIVQAPCDVYTTGVRNLMQEWTSVCNYNAICHYVNDGSGLCLRARGPNGVALGLQIMLWDCNSISDNNWVFRSYSTVTGSYSLESRLANSRGYCLDVPGGHLTTPGLALQLWYCNGTASQVFWSGSPGLEDDGF
jgi:hypothetical protein